MSITNVLAKRLRAAREKVGWSQGELAAKAGRSVSYVSMIEREERMPHLDVLADFAKALDVPVTYFFSESASETQLDHALYGKLVEWAKKSDLDKEQVQKLIEVGNTMFKG